MNTLTFMNSAKGDLIRSNGFIGSPFLLIWIEAWDLWTLISYLGIESFLISGSECFGNF